MSPSDPRPAGSVVYLCTDLLFTSKIRETAASLGRTAVAVRDLDGLRDAAREAGVVIVDLRRPDAIAALDAIALLGEGAAPRTVGFCDHEKVEVLAEAERRGCVALAKGRFSSELRHLLAPAASPTEARER